MLLEAGISERRTRVALACGLAGPAVETSAAQLREQVSVVPGQISVLTAMGIWGSDVTPGGTKLVATVAGFVVLGASVLHSRGRALALGEPGEWFDGVLGAQLLTGPGRQWKIMDTPAPPFPRPEFRRLVRQEVD